MMNKNSNKKSHPYTISNELASRLDRATQAAAAEVEFNEKEDILDTAMECLATELADLNARVLSDRRVDGYTYGRIERLVNCSMVTCRL